MTSAVTNGMWWWRWQNDLTEESGWTRFLPFLLPVILTVVVRPQNLHILSFRTAAVVVVRCIIIREENALVMI